MASIIFVTGTDTNVGKTVVTAGLLRYLKDQGFAALAMKPFCSGGRSDARVFQGIQRGSLSIDECNPFHFKKPVAPMVAARLEGQSPAFKDLCSAVRKLAIRCDFLLIEGAGGLLAPLGEGYCILDLMRINRGLVLVVATDRLGVINHTLLTIHRLRSARIRHIKVVLNQSSRGDISSRTNYGVLTEILHPVPVISMPFLGSNPLIGSGQNIVQKKFKKTLARMIG